MNTLTPEDLQFVVSRVPRDVRELMTKFGLVLGGGFIRETISQQKPNDIDLFGDSTSLLSVAAQELYETRGGDRRMFTTDNAITLIGAPRMPVQFITRWLFTEPLSVLESFDFTVCQCAIWYADKQWHSAISESFYSDLAARRLVYTSPNREEAAGGSMMRVRKFLARGYNIQAGSLAKVMARILVQVRASGLASEGEAGIAQVLHGLLREVDPLTVIDGIEPIEEHTPL